jgi:poly-beta-1,6-N-acetyl-D-glucosamine synthase
MHTGAAIAVIGTAAWYAVVVCLVYLGAMAIVFTAMLLVAARENRIRAREGRLEDIETLLASPFTIPVSVIAPAYNEELYASDSVRSLLGLDYSEHEVIVVNDGSTDGTLAQLTQDFDLEPTGTFYRHVLATAEIRQIYRSRADPRLTVVDKFNGGKADALNCGVNLARYRYVCCVDGDTIYRRDALVKGMRLAMQDPAAVVGMTGQILPSSQPEDASTDGDAPARVDRHMLVVYQLFDYVRAVVGMRLAWNRANYMLCTSGAFMIWRRDVVLELAGFSRRFTCEDIEFTFRVHQHFRAAGKRYLIQSLPDPVCVTEGPTSIAALVSQRERWQRVITETVWHYRAMLYNPKYGSVGMLGLPYYLWGEVLAPIFQLIAVVAIPVAALAGVMGWADLVRFLAILALVQGVFTCGAILLQDRNLRIFAAHDVRYLILLTPLEVFFYRPIIFYAQLKGLIGVVRGDKGWHKPERRTRRTSAADRRVPMSAGV